MDTIRFHAFCIPLPSMKHPLPTQHGLTMLKNRCTIIPAT